MKLELLKENKDGEGVFHTILLAETNLNGDEPVSNFNVLYVRGGYEVRITRASD